MDTNKRLQWMLLIQRISVATVLIVWTADKFLNPEHAAGVFANFYHIKGISVQIMYGIGALEVLLVGAFILGIAKPFSYGIVLLIHFVSTASSYKQYIAPYDGANILFFAAIPMLACCLSLFFLRDSDTLLAVKG